MKVNLIQNWLDAKTIKEKDKAIIRGWSVRKQNNRFQKNMQIQSGFRASIGLGSNYFNQYTIQLITVAFCQLLRKQKNKKKVLIFRDNRRLSYQMSYQIADILRSFGFEPYFFYKNTVAPTPFMSYLLKNPQYDYQYGIMITASHNHKNTNGIKLMDEQGVQWSKTQWTKLINLIQQKYNRFLNYSWTKQHQPINTVRKASKEHYLQAIKQELARQKDHQINILYSSLHGNAINWTDLLLQKVGYQVTTVTKQCQLQSNFPTVIAPNPENNSAFTYALKAAKSNKDVIILNDCDGDRMRVACWHQKQFHILSGNQIAVIFTFFMLRERQKKGALFRSYVSTSLVDKIARDFNCQIIKESTGFNNLAQKYRHYQADQFILAFEESIGFLPSIKINNDKDGIQSALLIAEIANFCKQQQMTLIDYLDQIYQKYGFFIETTKKYCARKCSWQWLRQKLTMITHLANQKILKTTLLAKNSGSNYEGLIFLYLTNHFKIGIRQSQTEKIIKIYFHAQGTKKTVLTILSDIIDDFQNQIGRNFCKDKKVKLS